LLAVVIGFEMYSPDKLDEARLLARRALKLKMIAAMRDDLLRLALGHPEASRSWWIFIFRRRIRGISDFLRCGFSGCDRDLH
jgi:hypothetical protein